jgi:hypothetical protein
MSDTDLVSSAPAAAPTQPRRRRVVTVRLGLAAGVLAVLILYAALPWEWSFIDDTGALAILHGQQDAHGTWGGAFGAATVWYRLDLGWGLFRPAFWLYAGAFYLLPPGAAHAVRLLMLALAVAGPLAIARAATPGAARRAALCWVAAVLATNVSLYRGLWFGSLQELSGLCCVGLGLLARRRTGVRLLGFLAAAWFKSPFAWLLVGYGLLLLLRRGSRGRGALSVTLGAGTLAVAAGFARSGSYTRLTYDAGHLAADARTAGFALLPVGAVLAAGAVALRTWPWHALPLRTRPWRPWPWRPWPAGVVGAVWPADPIGPGLLLGGLGYLANLLPWYTGVHYASPYVYLIGAGVALTLAPYAAPAVPRWWLAAGLAIVVTVGLGAAVAGARYVYRNAATTLGLRDCVLGLPDGATVGYNRVEAPGRLDTIVRFHRPATRTRIVLVPNGAPGSGLTDYIWEPDYGPGTAALRAGPVICRTPLATVYRIGG